MSWCRVPEASSICEKGPYPFFGVVIRKRGTAPFRATLAAPIQTRISGVSPERIAVRFAHPNGAADCQEFLVCLRGVDVIDPSSRHGDRSLGERNAARLPPLTPQTGPTPEFGSRHQVCSERIAFDIAPDSTKMFAGLHGNGFEPRLVDGPSADRIVRDRPSPRVGRCYPVYERRHCLVLLGPKQQMPMVAHQTVRNYSH